MYQGLIYSAVFSECNMPFATESIYQQEHILLTPRGVRYVSISIGTEGPFTDHADPSQDSSLKRYASPETAF